MEEAVSYWIPCFQGLKEARLGPSSTTERTDRGTQVRLAGCTRELSDIHPANRMISHLRLHLPAALAGLVLSAYKPWKNQIKGCLPSPGCLSLLLWLPIRYHSWRRR